MPITRLSKPVTIKSYNASPGSIDLDIIKHVPNEYASVVPYLQGARVLDIGANIGCFAAFALNHGAAHVTCVEPTGPAMRHLKVNAFHAVVDGRARLIHGGVVPSTHAGDTLLLRYFEDELSMGNTKTVDSIGRADWRGRPYVYEHSKAIRFNDLLKEVKPSLLKMDCEGAEYPCLLPLQTMPACVRVFIAEFHKTSTIEGFEQYHECVDKLRAWGFTATKQSTLKAKHEGGKLVGGNLFYVRPIAWYR